ncbi:succinate dehydrogenase, cytochrome b556 subunit [Solimonas marina]|uniref:Succinate dehydrogenase cytochrome b556 subunit n=1 Tax=Solimonas marina TaxID=2714601 RepID=A0A969W925_9GAMM|nr:succinate dehydrogenase, cytochrome b556 subunit [Solimonas marina]NKF21784.1 succinate dehydrogenase, cytochrome b556 subunit [Solimonas marina]
MSTKTPPQSRPLSPFMLGQYYRFQWSSLLSIIHRVTGVGLTLGSVLVALWLIALAGGPSWYTPVAGLLHSWFVQLLLAAWTWALMYHLCNGIRHLFWDIGRGFELKTARASGYVMVASSFILTVLVWAVACVA